MRKLIWSFFLLLSCIQVQAQAYLGASSSNYAGSIGNLVNPASFVDGRYKMDLALPAINLFTYQNFGYFNADEMRAEQGNGGYWWAKSFMDTTVLESWAYPSSSFIDRLIVHNYNAGSSGVLGANINFRLDLFNLAFHIGEKRSVGIYANLRSITNVDNMDPKLAVLSEEGLEYPALWDMQLNEELINVDHLTWSEIGFNYGQVLIDNKEHFLKIGITPKVLLGFASAYVHTNDFSYNLLNEDTSQYLAGTFDYGYSKEVGDFITAGVNNQIDENTIGNYLKPGSIGFGLDVGAIYEWRPNYAKYKYDMDGKTDLWMRNENKYKARVGVSILDMGSMKFTKGGLSRNFVVNTSSLFNLHRFETATDLETFDMVIDSLINESAAANNNEWVSLQDPNQTFRMRTPTAMSLQLDYHLWSHFYVNASAMVNMIPKKKDTKVNVASQLSITPSFDSPYFGLYVPIAYNKYSGLRTGLATRIGPVILGMNDMHLLRAKGEISGIDFYAGLRLPIMYHRVKDKDKDKVSDKMDECKTVPGTWAFLGCPDTDGDGIADSEDACVTVAGLKEFKGCPDTDGDKIIDSEDACPTVAGLKEFKGCPDTDGDKIIDSEDACPTVAGVVALKGCPDRDADGVTDAEDICPDNAGPKENQGCPDQDQDGLFDFVDNCPQVAGPKENQGCPWPDTDNDGLLDKDDECPTLAGPKANKGCPYKDSDKDGLLDKDDDCPNTPGPKTNKGCPVIEQAVIEVLKTAFDNLEFESAKDIIFETSKPSLNELAEVLKKKTTWKLEIAGHTDNVGDDNGNLALSKKRAEALKAYLISQGVEEARLITKYFGETKPIATNDTPEGRQKNRRVEMKIVFE
jgi:outer membrane protein OmpA-like peptidoglycan-associated protein